MTNLVKRLKNSDILKACGLTEKARMIEATEPESRYLGFLYGDKIISVECTAPDVADHLPAFFVEEQAAVLAEVAKSIPEPGDRVEIEHDWGKNKDRIAQIVRLKGAANEINLLISR